MSYDYTDQTVDSSFDTVPDIYVTVTDLDDVGYDAYSYYCNDSDDCSLDENWMEIDSFSGSGDDSFSLAADWGQGPGIYWVKVVLFPGDGSDPINGDSAMVEVY
jgi:hypothetical protein